MKDQIIEFLENEVASAKSCKRSWQANGIPKCDRSMAEKQVRVCNSRIRRFRKWILFLKVR